MLDLLRHKLNLYRRYPYWRRAGAVFVHVPKAAGTTINYALYGRTLGHYTICEIENAFPRLIERSTVFTVVRNPYDRLWSAYRFARAGRTNDMAISSPQQYRIPEFESYQSFVCDWLVMQDLEKIDHVFRPQVTYVTKGGRLAVDILCKLETLRDDMRDVELRIGRKLDLNPRNVLSEHAGQPTQPWLRREIHRLYEQDFELLGYAA